MWRRMPSKSGAWARLLLGVCVSVPVALAPLLGKLPVPLFPSLLQLIPESIRGVVLPLSTAAMSIVSILAEASVGENDSKTIRLKRLRRSIVYCFVSLILFAVAYTAVVTRVEILGGKAFVSFVTGWPGTPTPPCLYMGSAECVSRLSFRDSAISSHFGDAQIRSSSLVLECLYTLFFSMLGLSIARILELRAIKSLRSAKPIKAPKTPKAK